MHQSDKYFPYSTYVLICTLRSITAPVALATVADLGFHWFPWKPPVNNKSLIIFPSLKDQYTLIKDFVIFVVLKY